MRDTSLDGAGGEGGVGSEAKWERIVQAKGLGESAWEAWVLAGLAAKVQCLHDELGNAYYNLCIWIREKQISPKGVSVILQLMGFRKERVAEIKRVCFCSEELWNDYRRRWIGFRSALRMARREKTEGGKGAWLRAFSKMEKLQGDAIETWVGQERMIACWKTGETSFRVGRYTVSVTLGNKTDRQHK